MRKYIMIFLFVFSAAICYGQENIDTYISYLEKSVPENFRRINRTTYLDNSGSIVLLTEDNLVKSSSVGSTFQYTNEASEWLSFYYNYFENNNWEYSKEYELEIYIKDDVYAVISQPSKRDDGLIVAIVLFAKDFNWLLNNM